MEPKSLWAEAVVTDNDKIVYVGNTKEALHYQHNESELIDAKQKFVMPGFIDSHTHTALAALLEKLGVSLVGAKGKKEIIKRLKAYKKEHPKQRVYAGVGFYPYAFGPHGPSKEILDEIFPDTYAFFLSNNAHQAWVNSKTLDYLGIDKNSVDPQKNIQYYYRDKEGNPTGFLIEGEAIWPHFAKMAIATSVAFEKVLKDFLPQLSKQGITTLFDAGVLGEEEKAFKALYRLSKKDLLPLEYHLSHFLLTKSDAESSVEDIKRLQERFNSFKLYASSLKFINDNSDDDNFGITFKEAELFVYLTKIFEANENVMIHTSQDSSTHEALNAIEKAKKLFPTTDSRVTLAHVNMVRDSDFKRFKELGVIANIQSFNAVGGGYYEYRYILYDEKWEGKLARYRHFFDEGIRVSASSDYPVCGSLQECSPWYGIQIGLTRQKIGLGKDAVVLDSKKERTTLTQMLQAYTINAAYQLKSEDRLGSLLKGKDADIIMLDNNPFEIDMYELHKIKILRTWSKGHEVYKDNNE
jgi:predicted amidohydrolase YtcJ